MDDFDIFMLVVISAFGFILGFAGLIEIINLNLPFYFAFNSPMVCIGFIIGFMGIYGAHVFTKQKVNRCESSPSS